MMDQWRLNHYSNWKLYNVEKQFYHYVTEFGLNPHQEQELKDHELGSELGSLP